MVGNLTILRQLQRLTGIEGYERMIEFGENESYRLGSVMAYFKVLHW
jgi:hypothetical protein